MAHLGLSGAPGIRYWTEDIDAEHVALCAARRWEFPTLGVFAIARRAGRGVSYTLDGIGYLDAVEHRRRLDAQIKRRETALFHLYGKAWTRHASDPDIVEQAVAWFDQPDPRKRNQGGDYGEP